MGESMKVSIIVSVLNSHEIVRRQLLHYEKIGVPDGVEIILMDDGSDPPLEFPDCRLKNFAIYPTHETRPWTVGLARNAGARIAKGEYLLMTDIDYIIPRDAIDSALEVTDDRMSFRRKVGVLDEGGNLVRDRDVLLSYGLESRRADNVDRYLPPHPNNFVMRKSTYLGMGGYREELFKGIYPTGEDNDFKKRWKRLLNVGKATLQEYRPTLYMFPNGQFCGDVDYNPFGLFHTLTRRSK